MAQELRGLIETVKQLDFVNKDVQNKINTYNVRRSLSFVIESIRRDGIRHRGTEVAQED